MIFNSKFSNFICNWLKKKRGYLRDAAIARVSSISTKSIALDSKIVALGSQKIWKKSLVLILYITNDALFPQIF